MTDFAALGLSAPLLRALTGQKFTSPTEIQARAIPPLMEGRDLIGLAETGTGKTAAFLLPLMDRLISSPGASAPGRPRALILAPTRELAQQIGQAIDTLGGFARLKTTVVYGGAPMGKQLAKLKGGLDILVATPGRLMDHARRGSVKFDRTATFILDEADRMLDMGFVNDVRAIANALPSPHQTVLFSATINRSVEGLTKTLLDRPVRVDIARKIAVSTAIDHRVLHVAHENKKALLKNILADGGKGQVIVFTKTKRGADKLNRDLGKTGLRTDAIHGDRNQRQRQRTLNRFRNGNVDILIATDVAARGIDVPGIGRVVNYDLPLEPDAYVHRVGRTGRNGATGAALSLCAPDDLGLLRDIERLLKNKITVDAEHPFHAEPPARAPKPARKRTRNRPAHRKGGAPGARTKPGTGAKLENRAKPGNKAKPGGGAKPGAHKSAAGKPSGRKRRPGGRRQRAA